MRVALVHDWLNQYGGAERVLEVLHELFPEAPIFASMYAPDRMPQDYRGWDIRTSFMQRLPLVTSRHQMYLAVYPLAAESYDLSSYDVVISDSSGFCHGVVTRPETFHLSYCHAPPRYIWGLDQYLTRESMGRLSRLVLPAVISCLRVWDQQAAQRPDQYVANSMATARRVSKYYGRGATVIYPPVDVQPARISDTVEDYLLVVSRLIPYKRVDLAVEACSLLGRSLLVVGDGRDRAALQAKAGPTVRFLGHVPREELNRLISSCQALIFPGEEDFGIVPVEAQAAGRPVIAFAGGGALETVVEGETGVFFERQDREGLTEAIRRFDPRAFDPQRIRQHALQFDTAVFRDKISRAVAEGVSSQREGRLFTSLVRV
ncbi:MAG: glycosyltransferase family 4 protein [Chloroflexota bacterium]|nr:MAG: glycosyltransferase family 4 protein [Chloroflexota bacterium]